MCSKLLILKFLSSLISKYVIALWKAQNTFSLTGEINGIYLKITSLRTCCLGFFSSEYPSVIQNPGPLALPTGIFRLWSWKHVSYRTNLRQLLSVWKLNILKILLRIKHTHNCVVNFEIAFAFNFMNKQNRINL